jgi:hypothetical protein
MKAANKPTSPPKYSPFGVRSRAPGVFMTDSWRGLTVKAGDLATNDWLFREVDETGKTPLAC